MKKRSDEKKRKGVINLSIENDIQIVEFENRFESGICFIRFIQSLPKCFPCEHLLNLLFL